LGLSSITFFIYSYFLYYTYVIQHTGVGFLVTPEK
jgi:hypothetical protein